MSHMHLTLDEIYQLVQHIRGMEKLIKIRILSDIEMDKEIIDHNGHGCKLDKLDKLIVKALVRYEKTICVVGAEHIERIRQHGFYIREIVDKHGYAFVELPTL